MKIIDGEEMAARLEYRRPLHPEPEEPAGLWCIPFEYGANERGTRISIAKAKEISAELRAAVAEVEKRQIFDAFKAEEDRGNRLSEQLSKAINERVAAIGEVVEMKRRRAKRAR
jgi:hypothetical protein